MSDESNEIGNICMKHKTNAYLKNILKNKYLSWHLMQIQENFRGSSI